MLWIIGGTAETKRFIEQLRGRLAYIITVATDSGRAALPEGEPVVVGRMDADRMGAFAREHGISMVADLSHPYAVEVSQNARRTCQQLCIPYFRYLRERAELQNAVLVDSLDACLNFLQTVSGTVFFTTGSKHVADFQRMRGVNRFVFRVLPTVSSLQECASAGVAMQDIVAIFGVCSEELNVAMFRDYQARYVVMKDSGDTGGTPEKLRACARLGITPVVIARADEDGISDLDRLAAIVLAQGQFSSTTQSYPQNYPQ